MTTFTRLLTSATIATFAGLACYALTSSGTTGLYTFVAMAAMTFRSIRTA